MNRKLSLLAAAAALAAVPAAASAQPAGLLPAQTAARTGATPSVPARQMLAQFEKTTGATVVTSGALNLNTSVPQPRGLYNEPVRLMQNVAGAIGASWQRTWVVRPADASHPEASAAHLQSVIETAGTVGFDASGLPATDAIASVARADSSGYRIEGTLPVSKVTLTAGNMSVPDAIEAVSRATQTNWTLEYRLWPAPPQMASANVSPAVHRHMRQLDVMRQQQAQLEAPLTIHWQWPPTGEDPRVAAAIPAWPSYDPFGEAGPVVSNTPGLILQNGYGGYGLNGPIVLGGAYPGDPYYPSTSAAVVGGNVITTTPGPTTLVPTTPGNTTVLVNPPANTVAAP